MDFQGQKLSEQLGMLIVSVLAALGFVVGYLLQSFNLMIGIFGTGVALAFIVAVPDWPWFNRHPLQWLPPREQPAATAAAARRRKPAPSPSNLWGFL